MTWCMVVPRLITATIVEYTYILANRPGTCRIVPENEVPSRSPGNNVKCPAILITLGQRPIASYYCRIYPFRLKLLGWSVSSAGLSPFALQSTDLTTATCRSR